MNAERPPPSRLFETLEAPLAPLDKLPRSLWLGGMTNSQGALVPRLAGLTQWRAALCGGDVPSVLVLAWPGVTAAQAVIDVLRALELPAYCGDNSELTDTVLQSLLFHLDLVADHMDRGADEDQALAMAVAAFAYDWSERCGEVRALVEIFGDLGDLLKNTRWDQLRGLLRSSGWQEVLRARELIGELPELARIIRQLGRARAVEAIDMTCQSTRPITERVPVSQACPERVRVRVPDLPGETRGIRRSGRIARMLPAEAMMLAHSRLRLVWHARHAERALLTYEEDDCMEEVRHRDASSLQEQPHPLLQQRLEMGPMLICVDTSGSMQGGAEAVAKAVVLEAVRVAHAQRRACHVFAFSGPGEIVDLELAVDAGGLERLTRFLGQSFCGGTDVCGLLERVIARLDDDGWALADLLIASDGEFGATADLADRLRTMRDRSGLRVQGILIGDRETIGLLELVDDVFWVRDWRRVGGSSAASPVHSKSLTATYFPGALRTPENRAGTRSGGDASTALRSGWRGATS